MTPLLDEVSGREDPRRLLLYLEHPIAQSLRLSLLIPYIRLCFVNVYVAFFVSKVRRIKYKK